MLEFFLITENPRSNADDYISAFQFTCRLMKKVNIRKHTRDNSLQNEIPNP